MKLFGADETLQNITNTVSCLLTELEVSVSRTSIREAVENHSDYPSLLSIVDALGEWGIAGKCYEVGHEKITSLPVPLITSITSEGRRFVTITNASDRDITYSHPFQNRLVTVPVSDFQSIWSGIVLVIESAFLEQEKDYAEKRRKETLQQLLLPFISGSLLLWMILFSVSVFSSSFSHPFVLCGVLAIFLCGCLVSILLLIYEVDKYNPLLRQICSAGGKTDCSAVLDSAGARIFNWVSWSEIGFFYFSGGFLFLLLNQTDNGAVWILTAMSLMALPYCFYSVYYQWRIVRQWCPMCLTVQLLLVAGFGLLSGIGKDITTPFYESVSLRLVLIFSFSFLTPVAAWSFLKPFFLKAKAGNRYKHELSRLQNTPAFFETLLKQQKQVKEAVPGRGIVLGNASGSVSIIKVCNPYCAPCAKAHAILENLLQHNPEVRVQVIFNATNQEEDARRAPVNLLLYWYYNSDKNQFQTILNDWYNNEVKDYPSFLKKYPLPDAGTDYGTEIAAMRGWCEINQIEYTPTLFINGYQLPSLYSPSDITFLISRQ